MINEQIVEQVRNRVSSHSVHKNGKLSFTVEYGRGETYSNRELTVYAHDSYEKSSVLSGRGRRMWIGSFGQGTEQDARDTMEMAGVTRITRFLGGSTWVSVEEIVSHLPDDTDY